jgi:hypothetical protein
MVRCVANAGEHRALMLFPRSDRYEGFTFSSIGFLRAKNCCDPGDRAEWRFLLRAQDGSANAVVVVGDEAAPLADHFAAELRCYAHRHHGRLGLSPKAGFRRFDMILRVGRLAARSGSF